MRNWSGGGAGSQAIHTRVRTIITAVLCMTGALAARADEQVFGYLKGVEPMPQGGWAANESLTYRSDKGQGTYEAWDSKTEIERGLTDKLSLDLDLRMQSVEVNDLLINAYIPKDEDTGLEPSGLEASLKYMFLSPVTDPIGLGQYVSVDYSWLDPHSGQDKDTLSLEFMLLLQKYFLDGQLIWVANTGIESTYADRSEIDNLPEDFEWPTEPEMELEYKIGSGLSYRFAPKWFIGAEAIYETEFETEVGQERWSLFAGPTLHYGSTRWWATLTWFPQIEGGGEFYDGQKDKDLHLIEKTEQEIRLKVGYNF